MARFLFRTVLYNVAPDGVFPINSSISDPPESAARGDGQAEGRDPVLFGHPKGLAILFFTEMWERFSYYGMRSLLVLYMVKHLLLPDQARQVLGYSQLKAALDWLFGPLSVQATASQIYGIYTALVYLTPVLGGWLADRYWGQRKTIIIGALLMGAGHFMMAFEPLFIGALGMIILGNGAFKPNTTSQVGHLYRPGDPRRDRAYSIFYVGINLGAFLAPFICGTLGQDVGWHYGFGAAGVGMILATLVYAAGLRHVPADPRRGDAGMRAARAPLRKDEWRAIAALCILCLLNVLFWAIYEQQGNTIALWSDSKADRHIALLGANWEFPASWVQAINPFFIFALTPFLTGFWSWQARRGREPSSIVKMAIGVSLAGLSFLVMMLAAWLAGEGQASWLWLLLYFFFLTLGELYLSPIGLSLVSKVAPLRLVSMLTGMWFLAMFAGNYMAGWLGSFWLKMANLSFFGLMTMIGLCAGLMLFVLSFLLRPWLPETAPARDRAMETGRFDNRLMDRG